MEQSGKLEIELSNGAKDLEFLKAIDKGQIEELNIMLFKPISLRFLKDFKGLKKLMISGSVKDFKPVTGCHLLESLYLSGGTIDNLDFLSGLSIKSLTLENFRSNITELKIPNLSTLESISISKVSKISDLSFLSTFTQLRSISLFELSSKKLFDLSTLINLKTLDISNMFHLKNFSDLITLGHLDLLRIRYFFVNRQIKIDVEQELMKVLDYLEDVKVISLAVNDRRFNKP